MSGGPAITNAGSAGQIGFGDLSRWYSRKGGPSKLETASFLAFDVAPLFTPFAAISGFRRASFLRKIISAGRAGDKAFDVALAADKAGDMRLASTLFAAGFLHNATYYGTSKWAHRQIMQDIGESTIMYYMDREGRIKAILPSDLVISQFKGQGEQSRSLTKQTRSSQSPLVEGTGIERLRSFSRPSTLASNWVIASSRRDRPRKSSTSGGRDRREPTRSANKISPWCPRHKQRHWCSVTRAKFS